MNESTSRRILVAMSGGVDSAVCAYLLRQAGAEVTGVTMRLWSDNEALSDADAPLPDQNCIDAKAVADQLNIPHTCIALGDSFRRCVIDPFIEEYAGGKTPNPCVTCNRTIKFGKLMDVAKELGFSTLATGHYAKAERSANGSVLLKKATDLSKDQSYFLWAIPKEKLQRILFPLGNRTKEEIREIAANAALPCAKRTDSQDICFIPDGDYGAFICQHSNHTFPKGSFVSADGKILGQHNGLIHYTVGQRKGLGIAMGYPVFVGAKDPLTHSVILCTNDQLYSKTLFAASVNFLVDDDFTTAKRVEAKIRYRHAPAAATVVQLSEDRIRVEFDEPQRAIAPGQSVVLYDGDTVLGGGIIE